TDLNQRILIPGAGNAYEAGYLFQIGFQNVYICDWSPEPLQQFQLNDSILQQVGFIDKRAEELSISDFIHLSKLIEQHGKTHD
ncbi:MAG: hypothetical protein ACK461_10475, partial [Bacteroidota bacterium]